MSTNGHNHRQPLPILPAPSTLPVPSASPAHPALPKLPPVDWALPQEQPLEELERQMERGSQFTQAALDKLVGRLAGAEAYITELVEILRARGVLSDDDLVDEDDEGAEPSHGAEALATWEEPPPSAASPTIPGAPFASGASPEDLDAGASAAADPAGTGDPNDQHLEDAVPVGDLAVLQESADRDAASTSGAAPGPASSPLGSSPSAAREASLVPPGAKGHVAQGNEHGDAELSESGTQARVSWPGIAFRVDPEDPAPSVEVNCDERMHVCHAVCCKLNFALTPEEVDGGKVKWDLGFPYMIRHGANGYCSHNDTATGRCTNYANRPGVCHRYSCAHDPRIWKDFDNMVLNEDWIRANLASQSRIVVGRALPLMEVKHGNPSTA